MDRTIFFPAIGLKTGIISGQFSAISSEVNYLQTLNLRSDLTNLIQSEKYNNVLTLGFNYWDSYSGSEFGDAHYQTIYEGMIDRTTYQRSGFRDVQMKIGAGQTTNTKTNIDPNSGGFNKSVNHNLAFLIGVDFNVHILRLIDNRGPVVLKRQNK
ncbi:MAG: hypothetical protein GC181_09090 [Bacteroidetes bacterium]|nr:hypothetical protein [Bacteroidota bacterium]